ncbi:MAG: hypothetical protein F4Z36_04345 [Acidimicrobiia bacterium]|nr:hypothetical protein [Acidimicrobiia bacterium]
MADLPLIEIFGGVVTVFFGAIISLLIYFDKARRKDMTRLRKEVKKEMSAGFAQVNRRIDLVDQRIDRVDQRISSLYLHLVPKPTPGVVPALPEPPATPPEPELRTGTD